MLYGHGDHLVCFATISDELDGLLFRLWVLNELFELSKLFEEFISILQMDAIIIEVPMAFVESLVFGFVNSLLLL